MGYFLLFLINAFTFANLSNRRMKKLFIAILINLPFFATGQQMGMLYTNCSEVYDKGDTTICMEQLNEEQQLIRYYLDSHNVFSKKYQVEKNGDYAFQAVVGDFNSPKNGISYYYYQNTQLKKVMYFENDLLMDCREYYDKNANSLPIGTLKNGNGTFFSYDENGLNKKVFYYKNGKSSGRIKLISTFLSLFKKRK